MLSPAEAHERDMAEQRQIATARRNLEVFLRDAPRLHRFARLAVEHAVEQLLEEEQRYVRRWD